MNMQQDELPFLSIIIVTIGLALTLIVALRKTDPIWRFYDRLTK